MTEKEKVVADRGAVNRNGGGILERLITLKGHFVTFTERGFRAASSEAAGCQRSAAAHYSVFLSGAAAVINERWRRSRAACAEAGCRLCLHLERPLLLLYASLNRWAALSLMFFLLSRNQFTASRVRPGCGTMARPASGPA